MTILDQSIEEPVVRKKKNYFFDLIFAGLLLVLTLVRDVASAFAVDEMIMIVATAVALCYLFGYWWVNKPLVTSFRNVLFTILYGFALFGMSCALLFHLLYLSGSAEMTFGSCFIGLIVVALDAITAAFTKTITINFGTTLRLLIFACLIIPLSFYRQSSRINFTYRNYPDFLKLYEEHKSTTPFPELVEEYEESHGF